MFVEKPRDQDLLIDFDPRILKVVLDLVALMEKIRIDLLDFVKPFASILDGFGGKQRKEAVYILMNVSM